MERDERDQATDGQADATPPIAGYVPSKDVVREIVRAASEVRVALDRWQRHSALSEYPQDDVIGLAMDALFRLERAVNPRRQRWHVRQTVRLNFQVWPPWVRVGLRWSRDLTATILERHELQWMAGATREDFLLRLKDPSSHLETISITGDELRAFDAILEYLPDLDSLPEPPERPVKVADVAPIRCSKRALLRVMGKSEGYTKLLKRMERERALTMRKVPSGDGDGDHFEFTFADRREHRRLKEKVEAKAEAAKASDA